MSISIYRIRNTNTGLFSKGGQYCNTHNEFNWSKKGKVWTSAAAIRAHLRLYTDKADRVNASTLFIPKHWEVCEQTTDENGYTVNNVYDAKAFYEKKHLQIQE